MALRGRLGNAQISPLHTGTRKLRTKKEKKLVLADNPLVAEGSFVESMILQNQLHIAVPVVRLV